ncbi:hypothetical protein PVAND_014484 [Polypedilum vanderplanki]|uniref:Uncharacterized protein n=1 Tax=Polypedilum vanderplanki TaxID=319348 RepID=A0A9J6B9B5_POLVA|nr:hypothetical protein PVAND_014484 [Polypedilum vanderplanki]
MGKKKQTAVEDLLIPLQDNRICGTICVCQMTLILSCVALVYLTVAIYVPAYKIVTSGIEPNPVMCTTTRNEQFEFCNKTTYSEWCLSKGSSSCTQAFVHLRYNGSALQFSNCSKVVFKSCKGIYNCTKGGCFNISDIFDCESKHFGETYKCKARRGHVACRDFNWII